MSCNVDLQQEKAGVIHEYRFQRQGAALAFCFHTFRKRNYVNLLINLTMKGKCKMKNFTKVLSLLLPLTMLLCFPVAVSAAELEDAPIDESRTGSLTIYKYDLTNGASRS